MFYIAPAVKFCNKCFIGYCQPHQRGPTCGRCPPAVRQRNMRRWVYAAPSSTFPAEILRFAQNDKSRGFGTTAPKQGSYFVSVATDAGAFGLPLNDAAEPQPRVAWAPGPWRRTRVRDPCYGNARSKTTICKVVERRSLRPQPKANGGRAPTAGWSPPVQVAQVVHILNRWAHAHRSPECAQENNNLQSSRTGKLLPTPRCFVSGADGMCCPWPSVEMVLQV